MKKMIKTVAETSGVQYQLWAELAGTKGSHDLFRLQFSSIWTGAKHPEETQCKSGFFLDRNDINRLLTLIKGAIQ